MVFAGIEDCILDELAHGTNLKSKHENICILTQKHGIAQAVYVGDTESDREQAQLAGLPFVFVSYGFGSVGKYDLAFERFVDFVDFFDAL